MSCCWLKQSTAVDVMLGPFLDSADGNTVESGLTITQPDIRLSKNGGAFAQKSAAQTLAHGENGWYPANLSTTDTDTLGILIVAVHESGALPAWREFLVVPANIYDSFFSTDFLQVDLTQIGGVTQSATDLKDFADDGYDPSTNKVQGVVLTDTVTTYTGNTPQTGDSFARIGATGSGLTSLASQASLNTLDDFVDTEIADIQSRLPVALVGGRMDSSVGAMEANVLTASASAADFLSEINTEVDNALADARLDELLAVDSDIDGAAPPAVGSVFHELMSKSTDSFTFDQATDSLEAVRDKQTDIETDTQDVQGRLPAALTGGRMDANVGSVSANAINDAGVAADMDNYSAKVWVIKDGTSADRYAVRWYKNLVPITSGITSPTIQVIKASDGTDLIGSTALTEIGSTHRFKRDETTNKMTAGQMYFAVVSATIDGATRTFEQQVGRDAA